MEDSPLTLASLPTEILGSVCRLLDPIGLISISQTNSKFRSIIQPSRTHILERLLQLECEEEVGGGIPIFRPYGNRVDPRLTDKQWNEMRWACSICLKLLPQTAFDNHNLLRLRYRKPLPGSPAANLYTSWEPTKNGKPSILQRQKRMQQKQNHDIKEEDRKTMHRYDLAVKKTHISPFYGPADFGARLKLYQDSGMITFQGLNLERYQETTEEEERVLLDHEARLIELERCGFKRYLRKCNECRFQRREIAHVQRSLRRGTVQVPILPSRHMLFATALDRYFPNFTTLLESKRPAEHTPVRHNYRNKAVGIHWDLYMIRCPGCSRWQEQRAFRFGGESPWWKPVTRSMVGFENWDSSPVHSAFIDNLRCNHCYAKEHGREELGKTLARWLDCCFVNQRYDLGRLLFVGWESLSKLYERNADLLVNSDISHVVLGVHEIVKKVKRTGDYCDYCQVTLHDLSTLKMRYHEWMAVWGSLDTETQTFVSRDPSFEIWHKNYDLSEAHLIWAIKAQMEMTDKVDVLVDWALSPDRNFLA